MAHGEAKKKPGGGRAKVFGDEGAERGVSAAGAAEALGDAFDGAVPIGGPACETEGGEGVSGRAAVAEDAGAGVAGEADGLVPLDGIDIAGLGHGGMSLQRISY